MRTKNNKTLSALKESEKSARRNIIIDAAEMEFATKPFNRVNMRDIARRAGISPALIYRHFPDQQSLFAEAYVRGVSGILDQMRERIDQSPDGAIAESIEDFIDFFTRNDQYYRMMINFLLDGSVDRNLFDKLNVLERKLLGHFDALFEKMNIEGNIRYHSHTLFAALVGIVATFRSHPDKNEEDILKHRKRIAANLTSIYTSYGLHHKK
ncbi:MAG: TetR/AcrR family transcriptional regulator [Syntrophaceae bacterium]|nr:TetR/AcrR family transcriptional regulator [Syntrophaceae bacterium]HOC58621.1 TetR/AcrR family transcriptional regulator [Smithellaceae bacterium]HQM44568.1 TetR/AcrR family transcriptional regulator [Smithellaceae bacterium]